MKKWKQSLSTISALALLSACGDKGSSSSPDDLDMDGGPAAMGDGGDVQPPSPCEGGKEGERQTRTRYARQEVARGESCEAEEQTRSCSDSGWSAWSGSFEAASCKVATTPEVECDADEKETRTRFASETVPFGSECKEEPQTRVCENGKWSAWSGSHTHLKCAVEDGKNCGSTPHGKTETRERFDAESVEPGATCKQETQSRTCQNGELGAWNGSYTFEACTVLKDCTGDTETRTQYEAASVPYGETCESEEQTRTCTGSKWSDYSGTFTAATCSVAKASDCGDVKHGEKATRTMYKTESVAFGAVCADEEQTAACDNGKLGTWSGTYTFDKCTVGKPADCADGKHGEAKTRTAFKTSSVPYGQTCEQESQAQTCTNGEWSSWTGTYTFGACKAEEPKDCVDGKHGDAKTRTAFKAASVPYDQTCEQESQSQTCTNGEWSNWTGTYTFGTCVVEKPKDCADGKHGEAKTRTAFKAASVPHGQTCEQESQSQTCTNGEWSNWSGTFKELACKVEAPATISCDQKLDAVHVCHAYRGPDRASSTCAIGVQGTGCPAGAIGHCNLSGVGANPVGYAQYHYTSTAIADAAASKSMCEAGGGTWSAP